MNPHTPPAGQTPAEEWRGRGAANHPHYGFVLKMVLWGEDKEEVYLRMKANGVTGDLADLLYEHAGKDRIRTLRGECARTLLLGTGLVLAAAAVFAGCWYGLGFIPRMLLYGCLAALGTGLWKMVDGLAGYLMAPSKTGSITGDD